MMGGERGRMLLYNYVQDFPVILSMGRLSYTAKGQRAKAGKQRRLTEGIYYKLSTFLDSLDM